MSITCLIPFFNEKERIGCVLEVVTKIKSVTQVLCVDDGSTDGTSKIIKSKWPKVQLVKLPKNGGKTAAIRYGLQHVKNEHVLMMDADLQGLKKEEIEDAIKAYTEYDAIDMVILRRVNSPWFVKWYRSDVLLSGERILRTADLREILAQSLKPYQLEVAINRYMLRHKKQVRWVPWSALNTYKVDKLGVWDGSVREFLMYVDIVNYVGLSHMMLQLASFTKPVSTYSESKGFRYELKSKLRYRLF
ncbi:glycosyltransferase family 2 protein [Pontibacter harenae]|uniref:glycosyltransferase family 2 protein n=1 Tax=Pontibacter harenae TaxID=2894083 RepID=UPI001E55E78C|nr:glycosyltransferase family 2 protein [Pontibacter harenae]MCC9168276.1 glycosyltransferase family 2 protein [Pontibacter harenae]